MKQAQQELALTGADLTLEQVAQVAESEPGTVRVFLSPKALPSVKASRAVVDSVLSRGDTVYGINTGFGALSHVTIPLSQVEQLQLNLVRSHAAGTGGPLQKETVRAMMLLRANTLAKGVSGVRPALIHLLTEMLNNGVHPWVPSQGSLGASGDLAPLAHMSLVMLGEGNVLGHSSARGLSGAEALRKVGLMPLTLQAKEGLALLNGTQMMTAMGVRTALNAESLARVAEVAGAMTVEAVRGSVRPFSDKVSQVRPHPGQRKAAAISRKLLEGSQIMVSHRDCAKVQDPYSLRCIPQVHGAAWDAIDRARATLLIECNSATDNPLVFPDGDIISQGNFHGEPVAMVLDGLAVAMAELGSISERRIDKLMNPVFSGLPAFLANAGSDSGLPGNSGEGLHSGLMIVHYTAASLVSENKTLSHPACVDSIPTSNDKEDHVSMGAWAARKAHRILRHTRWILAAELFSAAQGLEYRGDLSPGKGVLAAYQKIREVVPPLAGDRSCAADVEKVSELLDDGSLLAAVEAKVGPLLV